MAIGLLFLIKKTATACRSNMKKTARFLFLVATLFTVAGAFAVSCQKEGEGEEEEIPGASGQATPWNSWK